MSYSNINDNADNSYLKRINISIIKQNASDNDYIGNYINYWNHHNPGNTR